MAGLLYVYYNKYIHPTALSITISAEGLLGVIAGGVEALRNDDATLTQHLGVF